MLLIKQIILKMDEQLEGFMRFYPKDQRQKLKNNLLKLLVCE